MQIDINGVSQFDIGQPRLEIRPAFGVGNTAPVVVRDWDCPVCGQPNRNGSTAIHHLIRDHQWTDTGARAWGICQEAAMAA